MSHIHFRRKKHQICLDNWQMLWSKESNIYPKCNDSHLHCGLRPGWLKCLLPQPVCHCLLFWESPDCTHRLPTPRASGHISLSAAVMSQLSATLCSRLCFRSSFYLQTKVLSRNGIRALKELPPQPRIPWALWGGWERGCIHGMVWVWCHLPVPCVNSESPWFSCY